MAAADNPLSKSGEPVTWNFKLLAQNDLGEQISASPAISNGRIYIRTFDALYAIGSAAAE